MKQAGIYVNDVFCGVLTEDEEGYHFCYDKDYLVSQGAAPVSPTMPLTEQQYDKEMMFPVFDGIIPEGWLLDIASTSWKIDPRDRMIERMVTHVPKWKELIGLSLLPEKMKIDYCTLLDKRKSALDKIKKE